MLFSRYSYLRHRPGTPRANTSFIPSYLLSAPRVESEIRRAFPENPAKSIQALAAAAPYQLGVPGNASGLIAIQRLTRTQLLICSIKGEVKKKHFSFGWNFSCFSAHSIELVLF